MTSPKILEKFALRAIDFMGPKTYELKNGQRVDGQSVSFLLDGMRDAGWKNLGSLNDFEDLCTEAGFKVAKGNCCIGRRARTARIVYLP